MFVIVIDKLLTCNYNYKRYSAIRADKVCVSFCLEVLYGALASAHTSVYAT